MAISVISGGRCAALVSDFQSLVTVDTDVRYMRETRVPELLSSEKRRTSAEFSSQWLLARRRGIPLSLFRVRFLPWQKVFLPGRWEKNGKNHGNNRQKPE